MAHIFELDSYTAPVDYLINHYIREYDISKANISILLYKNLITKEQYDYYYTLPKQVRAIQVGLLQRDNLIIKEGLRQGFEEARMMFYENNKLNPYNILAIKKDAVFIINTIPKVTKFNNIKFINKNIYTSFYNLDKCEYYYYSDNNKEILDIKGISDNTLYLHQNYMLDYLKYIFYIAQQGRYKDCIDNLKHFYLQYINYELDIGYYRELNNRSLFRTKYILEGDRMFIDGINKYVDKHDIDGSYNIRLLMELYKIYTIEYIKGVK